MTHHTPNKQRLKTVLLVGTNAALLSVFLTSTPVATAQTLTQQVTAEPSIPEVASGQSHRSWSRKQEDRVLAEAKLALATGDAAPLLRLYDWNGVTSDGRRSITETANALVRRKIDSIVIQPKGVGGNISYIEDGRVYSPNGDVVAHLIFKPNDGSASVDLPLGLKEKNLVVLAYKPSPLIRGQQKSPQKWSRHPLFPLTRLG